MPTQKAPPLPQGVADKLSGELMARRRGSRGPDGRFWTTSTLAQAIGVTERTIYNIEHGAVAGVAFGTVLNYCLLVGFDLAALPGLVAAATAEPAPATAHE